MDHAAHWGRIRDRAAPWTGGSGDGLRVITVSVSIEGRWAKKGESFPGSGRDPIPSFPFGAIHELIGAPQRATKSLRRGKVCTQQSANFFSMMSPTDDQSDH